MAKPICQNPCHGSEYTSGWEDTNIRFYEAEGVFVAVVFQSVDCLAVLILYFACVIETFL